MSTTKTKSREDIASARFEEISEKYRRGDLIELGEATPDELRELGLLHKELTQIRAARLEEAEPAENTADHAG